MDDDFRIRRRLEDGAAANQFAAQLHRVGDVAIMRDGETARIQFGIERLHVAQRGFAGGGIADMAARASARQAANHVVAVEIAGDMAHGPMGVELMAVPAGYAGCFLAAML